MPQVVVVIKVNGTYLANIFSFLWGFPFRVAGRGTFRESSPEAKPLELNLESREAGKLGFSFWLKHGRPISS